MSDRQTGPWALALGALAIGVGAMGSELLRQRREDGAESDEESRETGGA